MTLTIELSPKEEVRLREQARRQGQNAEERARELVRAGLNVHTAEVTARGIFLRHLREQGDDK